MNENIPCPNCNHTISPKDLECSQCGIELGIAAILMESNYTDLATAKENVPVAPEILVPRLGDHLAEQGHLTKEQLREALDYQLKQSSAGNPILLGQALLKLNLINQSILDQAVTEQIIMLQNALQLSNQRLEQRVRERTKELQQALVKITEANQLKTHFVSNMSHELRTPLAHMTGYLDLLQDGALGALNDDQQKAVNVLVKSNNRLSGLIDSLIQFSLVAQGELSLEPEITNVADLIKLAVGRTHSQAQASEVNLKYTLPGTPLQIKVDKEKITWVFSELIKNAIKFNEPHGEVKIAVDQNNGFMDFSITDNGIGIDEAKIDTIFEPFHQIDGSATRKYGGTGIGLSLAQQILEAHGADLKVHSKLGEGSSFRFKLPIVV